MPLKQILAAFALIAGCAVAAAQQTSQVQLKIEAANRTLTVTSRPGAGTAVRATLPLDEQLLGLLTP